MLARLATAGNWCVLALDYELGYVLEPHAAPIAWPAVGRPVLRYWRFAACDRLDREAGEARLAGLATTAPAGICELNPGISAAAYEAAVDRIQRFIVEGDCYQVNFTFPLDFAWYGRPLDLYVALRQAQPVRYGGFIGDGRSAIVSLSPELFLERRGSRLVTRPMKGTLARECDPAQLAASVKDRAENLMIVDLLRNDLGRVARTGSVRVDRLFDIEAYPSVWQMVSTVSAEVGAVGLPELLGALFPCGSITGAPKIRAMQIAASLETGPRGLYTGSLGWLAPDGDFRLNVAIRTLELMAGHRGRMGVGSGIVADSRAAAEWQECLLKARFLRELPSELVLIETLRGEDGTYPDREWHCRRLAASATALGFDFSAAAVDRELAAVAWPGRWRVRLTLSRHGECTATAFPLVPEPLSGRLARIAPIRIDPDDPLRRHKTTARALYDQALGEIAETPAVFDQVFLNTRGEVAEGARSTVFVPRDGVLLTPPLRSGALPGILRAQLLARGEAREAVLWPADLAAGFYLGNALRGLVPVTCDDAICAGRETPG